MQVAVLNTPGGMSAYAAEILRAWGVRNVKLCEPAETANLDPRRVPVLLAPASEDSSAADGLLNYAKKGGVLLSCLPSEHVEKAVGLKRGAECVPPLSLRITGLPAAGLAGEHLPLVLPTRSYEAPEKALPLAWTFVPGKEPEQDALAVVSCAVGAGRAIIFGFDLPRVVMHLRQGDPRNAERSPLPIPWCHTPNFLACELGPSAPGWVPFADLLGRWLVDLVQSSLPAPVPLLWHLPEGLPALVLYSGDEDGADVDWNTRQMANLAEAGARMNLYIIPNGTKSTAADARRYREHHDLGPHPDLRALDGKPVPQRLAEYEQQVRQFEERFGQKARSVRNHCAAWAGYMDLVEVQERLGLRMDVNYITGGLGRARAEAPYASFGGALPLRFCRPDGRLLQVFQQHTHLEDDVLFRAQWNGHYSYKLDPNVWESFFDRVLDDSLQRLHVPVNINIHPSNWIGFSNEPSNYVLQACRQRNVPVWSVDQWLDFWEARDAWAVEEVTWDGQRLRLTAAGSKNHPGLRWMLPAQYAGRELQEVRVNGEKCSLAPTRRYRHDAVPLRTASKQMDLEARYD